MSDHSPMYAEIEVHVRVESQRIVTERITPWAFAGTDTACKVENFFGREIMLRGCSYGGSTRYLFWSGFIEPFLKDLVIRCLDHAVELARRRGRDQAAPITDTVRLLKHIVGSVYFEMKEIDDRHQGPRSRPLAEFVDTEFRVAEMRAFVDDVAAGHQLGDQVAVPKAGSSGDPVAHTVAPDGGWLRAQGQTFKFKKGNQSAAVLLLWEAWQNAGGVDGCGLSEEYLGEQVGSSSSRFRVQDTFRGNDALGTIIRATVKGSYALFLNEEISSE